jgi:hypothetical protein
VGGETGIPLGQRKHLVVIRLYCGLGK